MKTRPNQQEHVRIGEQVLEEVDSFCYLGSIIDRNGGTEADVKSRIGKAQAAFLALRKVWKTRDISLKTKLKLFNSNVKSVLLYGCETWNASKSCIRKVQVFINQSLRKILRIGWMDKIKNEEVWKRAGQRPVEEEIGKRRWRWMGHTLRKENNSIPKKALDWNPQGKRTRGRPRLTWRRIREGDVERSGKSWKEIKKIAQDRKEWKGFVGGLYPGPGS